MALVTHLKKKTYVYDAITAEAPLLQGNLAKDKFSFANVGALPDLTQLQLSPVEASFLGTVFDEFQRFVVTGQWNKKRCDWPSELVEEFPLLPLLNEWVDSDISDGEKALTLGFFDNMRRAGPLAVLHGKTYGHLFSSKTVDQYVASLPGHLIAALKVLRELNSEAIEKYRAEPVHIPGPTFTASHYVGGADADAVYGKTLVEVKTSKNLNPTAVRDALTQALAYTLLDSYNEYLIEEIEVWFPRQRYNLKVPVKDLIGDLEQSRASFRERLIAELSPEAAKRNQNLEALFAAVARDKKHYGEDVDRIYTLSNDKVISLSSDSLFARLSRRLRL